MDKLSPEARSRNMAQIKNKDTQPEETVRRYLFSKGFRYRKNDKRYPGKPDMVLPKYKTVIFVNGCFWHCHSGCKDFLLPKSNADFWRNKLYGNKERDKQNFEKLKESGWNVIVVWECELEKPVRDKRLEKLSQEIIANSTIAV